MEALKGRYTAADMGNMSNLNGLYTAADMGYVSNLNGLYTITNVLSETRLDLANGNKADGSKVVAWAPHQPTAGESYGNQVWEIKPSKSRHCYTIVNAKTGTYLEVVGGMGEITRLGVDGVQVTCSKAGEDTPSYQEWCFLSGITSTKQPVGSYTIYNSEARLLLDVEGGSRNNGAKIQIHCALDIGNVKELCWFIEPAEYSKPGTQTTVGTMQS